jgi:hypothetical protein
VAGTAGARIDRSEAQVVEIALRRPAWASTDRLIRSGLEPHRRMRRHSTVRRTLLAAVGLVLLSACGSAPPATSGRPLQAAAAPPRPAVADYFSPPQPFPGPTWTLNGRPVDGSILNSFAGPEHCGWQSATMMHLGRPIDTLSRNVHQFIRDPDGVVDRGLRERLAPHATLPADARGTGYRDGELELWLAPSDPDSVYLRAGDDVERWPRAQRIFGCA